MPPKYNPTHRSQGSRGMGSAGNKEQGLGDIVPGSREVAQYCHHDNRTEKLSWRDCGTIQKTNHLKILLKIHTHMLVSDWKL